MTLRLLILCMVLVLPLAGCYTWDATDKPISGVKITTPANEAVDVPGHTYTFSGSIVANQPRHLYFGIRYRPYGYEAYATPGYEGFVLDLDTILTDQINTYTRNVQLPEVSLPGRYLFYSFIQDARGKYSDTNRTYRDVKATNLYPVVIPQSAQFSEDANLRNRGDLVTIAYKVNDALGIDTIRFELCVVGDGGRLFNCVLQSDTGYKADSTNVFERYGVGRFQIPFDAISSQRYRARLVFKNRQDYRYIWQPLFQIN